MSSPQSFMRRDFIRSTWMKDTPNTVSSYFVVSKYYSIKDEYYDVLKVDAPETYPPGFKVLEFFKACVSDKKNTFCIKTDDDVVIHTPKLVPTLKNLYKKSNIVYMGATLWASYSPFHFQVCGYGMGPKSSNSAYLNENCRELGSIGPFPYTAGVLEVLSYDLAFWITHNSSSQEFVTNALVSKKWKKGEDTVLGMFVYESPFPTTALHAGWDKIHDLCFECKDKTQLWRPVTKSSLAVHLKSHQATYNNYINVFQNMSKLCDNECQQIPLEMVINDLRDVCSLYDEMLFHYKLCEYDY